MQEENTCKAIQGLGQSAFAYQAAKQILERKYGGTRRRIIIYLDALENFKPIGKITQKILKNFQTCLIL